MIKLTRGFYGPSRLGPGTVLELPSFKEERLVKRKVAEYIKENVNQESIHEEIIPEEPEEYFKTEDELHKMKVDELLSYAAHIGAENVDKTMKKDTIINEILNFIEENSDEVED